MKVGDVVIVREVVEDEKKHMAGMRGTITAIHEIELMGELYDYPEITVLGVGHIYGPECWWEKVND